MPTIITNGDMSANISTEAVPVLTHGKSKVMIRIAWNGTGSPLGGFGIKLGNAVRRTDMGLITGGRFDFVGAQPDGSVNAGSITTEFETAAQVIEVYYTRTSGGAANTTCMADVLTA